MFERLLVLTTRYPIKDQTGWGGGKWVFRQVDSLKKHFSKVVVIAATPYIPKILSGFSMLSKGRNDHLVEDYHYDNVEVYYPRNIFFPSGWGYRIRGRQFYRGVRRILERIEYVPDIIHSHFTWPTGYASMSLGKKLGIPNTLMVHDNNERFESIRKRKYITNVWKNHSTLIRASTEPVSVDTLRKFNNNVFVITSGYSKEEFGTVNRQQARKELNLDSNKKIIFSTGPIKKRKGQQLLVQAISVLNKERDDVEVFLGGQDIMGLEGKTDIPNIHFLGNLSDRDMNLWFSASDIYSITSYAEGTPCAMYEAFGCGIPIVSTSVGGIPGIIIDDDYGFLTSHSPKDISDKLRIALDKDWDENAIKKYGQNFEYSNVTDRFLRVYEHSKLIMDTGQGINFDPFEINFWSKS